MSTRDRRSLPELNANSLYQAIGIRLLELDYGLARSELAPKPAMCWPFEGPHGGILFTQMDTTMALAAIGGLAASSSSATVSLAIEFTHPAKGERFDCSAEVVHRSQRMCFVRAESRDRDGTIVALGQGAFRVIDGK